MLSQIARIKGGKLPQVLAKFYIKGSIGRIQPIFDTKHTIIENFIYLFYYMNFNYISYTLTEVKESDGIKNGVLWEIGVVVIRFRTIT